MSHVSEAARSRVEAIVERHGRAPTRLVQVLREVQEPEGWIPPEAITQVARALGLSRARVEGVAGFYAFLQDTPGGRYRVRFSDNVIDRMAGSEALLDRMCRQLLVERGKVSEDGLVSVDTTSCTGLSDQGPGLLVNGWAIGRMTEARVDHVAELVRGQAPLAEWPRELFAIEDNVRREDVLLRARLQPGEAIAQALARGADLLDEMRPSNIRGRGGAGFSTALKWQSCREAPGHEKYVVCNADEGEPGTFKDRVLIDRQPDLLLDGMTVCARAVGARHGFIYLRGEYLCLLEALEGRLARRREAGLLGRNVCGVAGFDFDVEVHLGAGAYICGEESALIESLEGKRGVPRNRPPYPVTSGYLGHPTVVNNVETFCAAALVALHGGDWYAALGTPKSSGTKLLSVSGDVERPGIYEYPFGVTVRRVLEDAGAKRTQAVQVGGPSGTCIDHTEFDRRIGFEDLATAGAFMVFDETRDMFEVARQFTHFFAHESCGFCTPCRVGTSILRNLMDKLAEGRGSRHDLMTIEEIERALHAASHCGLGHTACNPVVDTVKRFRPAYELRMRSPEFAPALDLDEALAHARLMTGRRDAGAHLEEATT